MATKEPISLQHPFKALGRIPGANILVPLLLGVFMNTFFPDVFPTLGSFTAAMTVKGTAALVGAFMLCVGATISFKSAPKAALRGAIIIISKVVFCVALGLAVLFFLNDNLLGLSSMVILAACSGANNSMYAGLMADYGNEYEQGAVAITTLVVGPPVTMLALGATGQSPINWSLLGAVLPIILGILLGNCFPSMKKMLTSALPAIIVMTFFAMGTTMKFDSLIMAGPAGDSAWRLSALFAVALSTTLLIKQLVEPELQVLQFLPAQVQMHLHLLLWQRQTQPCMVVLLLQQQTHR